MVVGTVKRKGFTKIEISVDRGIYDRTEVVTRTLHGLVAFKIIIEVFNFRVPKFAGLAIVVWPSFYCLVYQVPVVSILICHACGK